MQEAYLAEISENDGTAASGSAPQQTTLYWRVTEPFAELFSAEENAARLVEALQVIGQTVATAESCTGGLVSAAIVSVPGASNVFQNGFIAYCDEAKHRLLQVSQETLDIYTAVSAETAAEMAYGCCVRGQADLTLAVTGLAGPGGGTEEKPVGLVYVSCCYHERIMVQEYHFQGDREAIRSQAAAAALQLGYFCLRIR